MTYISREEALAIEDRRARALRMNGVSTFAPLESLFNQFLGERGHLDMSHVPIGVDHDPDLAEFIYDMLDATEPPVYAPSTEVPSHDASRAAWYLSDLDRSPMASRILNNDTRLKWVEKIHVNKLVQFYEVFALTASSGDMRHLIKVFNSNAEFQRHLGVTVHAALGIYGGNVSPYTLAGYVEAEPLRVPTLPTFGRRAREVLRSYADARDYPVSADVILKLIRECHHQYMNLRDMVRHTEKARLIGFEDDRRRPIYDALTSRGVYRVAASYITSTMRKQDRVSLSDAEASSYAEGWRASKGLPSELTAELMGVPQHIVESALLLEKMDMVDAALLR